MQSGNKGTTSSVFCKISDTRETEETEEFKYKLPVTTFDNNNGLVVSEEENICHCADSEEELSGSSRASLEQNQSNNTNRMNRERGYENTISTERFREKLHKDRFYGMLSLGIHLISGYCENKQFRDCSGVSQTIPLERFARRNHSNSLEASRTIDFDARSSHGMLWNTDCCSYQEKTSNFRKKGMVSSYSRYNNHQADALQKSNMFSNISSEQLAPINYQVVNKASNSVKFNGDALLFESKIYSMTFNEDDDEDFKALFYDSMEVTDSEKLSHSIQRQCESSCMTDNKDELFELDSDCISDNQDEMLIRCNSEKIIETKSDYQGSRCLLQKLLNKIDPNRITIFPLTNIQQVKNKTNDQALISCNLTNALSVSHTTALNSSVSQKQALPKFLYPKSEVPSLRSHVKSRSMIIGTSAYSFEDVRTDEAARQLVCVRENTSLDNFMTFSSEMEYIRKKEFSKNYRFSNTESEGVFKMGMKKYLRLPKAYKSIQNSAKPNLFSQVNEKKKLEEEICQKKQNFHDKTHDFEVQQNAADNKDVFDTNNCISENSKEYHCSSDGFSEDEENLYGVDNFYDCLEEIPFESLENISETKPCSTDDDFSTIWSETTVSMLLFQEPVIFKYVDDDTHEVDEIMIYPKDCMENISKNGDRTLTREEILPKLIEKSKFYDGKSIGIVMHVRAIRKAIKNRNNFNHSEYFTSTSIAHGNREPSLSRSKGAHMKNSKKPQIPIYVDNNKRNGYAKKTTGVRNQHKCSTPKQKPCGESKTIPKSFSQTFKKLNILNTKDNKSHQQVEKDSSGVLLRKVYNISAEKYQQNNKGDYHQKEHKATSGILYKVTNNSVNSDFQYQNNEGEGDQIRIKKDEDVIPVKTSSPVRKLDITLFKQRTCHFKYLQQSSYQSKAKSRHTTSSSSEKNVYSRKPWGSASHPTRLSSAIAFEEILEESSFVRRCSSSRIVKRATFVRVDDVSTLALQKYNGSSPAVMFAHKLRIPVRKNLIVEDIVSSDFRAYFCFYAKIGKHFKSGSAISKANSNHWLRRTGVVFDTESRHCAEDCFAVVAKCKLVLNIFDYVQYLSAISRRTKVGLFDLVLQLKSVDIATEQHGRRVSFEESVSNCAFKRSQPPRSLFTLSSRGQDSNQKPPSQRTSKIHSTVTRNI